MRVFATGGAGEDDVSGSAYPEARFPYMLAEETGILRSADGLLVPLPLV